LHFFKLVAIVKMRIYLDFELDESYTPTKMKFCAGMSEGGLVEFGSWQVTEIIDPETGTPRSSIEGVRGWIDISLKGVGGRETRYHETADAEGMVMDGENTQDAGNADSDDRPVGDVLKAMVVQVRICENHQNGKDTHVRGFQVFSRDETAAKAVKKRQKKGQSAKDNQEGEEQVVALQPADWMRDPDIR
jgi:Anaphase-promoting complex, subunit 10 (APC10)